MTLEEQIKETEKQIRISEMIGIEEEVEYFKDILDSLKNLQSYIKEFE